MYSALIVGGDHRNKFLADILNRRIFNVAVCGFGDDIIFKDDIIRTTNPAKSASMADVIIFGLPMSTDMIKAYCPLGNDDIYIREIIDSTKEGAIIAGGRIKDEISTNCKPPIFDYSKRDDFAYFNAVPTAEGAIEKAMSLSQRTIHGSLCMVTGFGKCSEILAMTLKSMGAIVHVFARSARDLAHSESLGFSSFHLNSLAESISAYDMIFNSVPFGIFTNECTKKIKPECIFIDIASAPGGINEDACKTNLNYSFLPGLPGRYSPYTAAQIIEKVILTIMRESGKDAYRWILRD